jgi:lipopolysaccharide export system permease protein
MKYLAANGEHPIGYYVDHLARMPNGNLEKSESFESFKFSSFQVQPIRSGKGSSPIENSKLSHLLHLLTHKKLSTAFEYPQVLSCFLHKCMMPWLSFLVLIAVAPFCLNYSRSTPIFFIYTLALFSFIAFAALIDAMLILGENHIISPYAAVLLPFVLCFFGFGWKFLRTQ